MRYALRTSQLKAFGAWSLFTEPPGMNCIAGERYDVVIEAINSPGSYWIHLKGLATCVAGRIYQLGVLQYEVTPTDLSDPGYDGFPPSTNYRVSYNSQFVIHIQTSISKHSPFPASYAYLISAE
jgi:hypothetical protein